MYCEFFHLNSSNISSNVYVSLKNKQTKTLDSSGRLGKALQLLYLILIFSVKYFLIYLVYILPASRHRDSEWQSVKKRGKERPRTLSKSWREGRKSQCHIFPSVRLLDFFLIPLLLAIRVSRAARTTADSSFLGGSNTVTVIDGFPPITGKTTACPFLDFFPA